MAHVERSESRTPSQPEARPEGVVLPFTVLDAGARRVAGLTQMIEGEIIPRLLLAHGCEAQPEGAPTRIPDALDIDTLTPWPNSPWHQTLGVCTMNCIDCGTRASPARAYCWT